MSQSIGLLEVKGLLASVEATDAMVKSTSVSYVGCRTSGQTVLLVISGEYNMVCASLEVGMRQAESFDVPVARKHVIALPHVEHKKMLDDLLSSNILISKEALYLLCSPTVQSGLIFSSVAGPIPLTLVRSSRSEITIGCSVINDFLGCTWSNTVELLKSTGIGCVYIDRTGAATC